MSADDAERIARAAFNGIRAQFPALTFVEETDAPVEISIVVPVQAGLKFQVWLALQNADELHFSVEGRLWLRWFPCTDPARVAEFVDAVSGLLSGRYRVLEQLRFGRCLKAELQAPEGEGWKTLAGRSFIHLPVPGFRTFREVRNT